MFSERYGYPEKEKIQESRERKREKEGERRDKRRQWVTNDFRKSKEVTNDFRKSKEQGQQFGRDQTDANEKKAQQNQRRGYTEKYTVTG